MKNKGVTFLLLTMALGMLFLFLPHVVFESESSRADRLLDHFGREEFPINLLLLLVFYPVIFGLTSSLMNREYKWYHHLVFGCHFVVLAFSCFVTWLFMSLQLFVSAYSFTWVYYASLFYLLFFTGWSMLLALPFTKRWPIIYTAYQELKLWL